MSLIKKPFSTSLFSCHCSHSDFQLGYLLILTSVLPNKNIWTIYRLDIIYVAFLVNCFVLISSKGFPYLPDTRLKLDSVESSIKCMVCRKVLLAGPVISSHDPDRSTDRQLPRYDKIPFQFLKTIGWLQFFVIRIFRPLLKSNYNII